MRRVLGLQSLASQDWQRAGDVFGPFRDSELCDAVGQAWGLHADKGELDQARFRYRLVHFLFWHIDFESAYSAISHQIPGTVRKYAADYPKLLNTLRGEDRCDSLDFSHLELLAEVEDAFFRQGRKVTAEHECKVFEALRQTPDSVPALVAFDMVLQTPGFDQKPELWKKAERLLTCRLGKLTLARAINAHCRRSRELDLELAERVLATGWDLAPSNEQKAILLLGLAELEARLGRPQALATAAKVYDRFPFTSAAASARTLAIHIHLYGHRLIDIRDFAAQPSDAPAKALAFLKLLQTRMPAEHGGLDQALLDLAWNQRVKKQLDQSAELLHDLLKKYPGLASGGSRHAQAG